MEKVYCENCKYLEVVHYFIIGSIHKCKRKGDWLSPNNDYHDPEFKNEKNDCEDFKSK